MMRSIVDFWYQPEIVMQTEQDGFRQRLDPVTPGHLESLVVEEEVTQSTLEIYDMLIES